MAATKLILVAGATGDMLQPDALVAVLNEAGGAGNNQSRSKNFSARFKVGMASRAGG
jgi:hypothetical protein